MDPISSSPVPSQTQTQYWTDEENTLFENALAEFDHVFPDLFEKIATRLPSKTVDQIKQHYEDLVHDIEMIEAGLVPLPNYEGSSISISNSSSAHVDSFSAHVVGGNTNDHRQRRKPSPWTLEEHELFLEGLEKYGKGDWRSISRNCVKSKTPTQVASHAQKHFLRLERNMASTTSRSIRNSITSNLNQGAPPSTLPYANILAAAPQPSFIFSNTDRGASLSTLPYANHAIALPPSFRSLNTDQGASPSTMPYAIHAAAAPPPSLLSSNTNQGAARSTMPSFNLAAAPPSSFMAEDTSAPLIASLPSFSDLSTVEEVNQLFASHSPSYDPKQ